MIAWFCFHFVNDGWLNQSFKLIVCCSISIVSADCESIYSLIGVILMMTDWINPLDWFCVDPFPWLLQVARVTQSSWWSWWSSCFFFSFLKFIISIKICLIGFGSSYNFFPFFGCFGIKTYLFLMSLPAKSMNNRLSIIYQNQLHLWNEKSPPFW